jgi:hypothetical protein
MKKQQPNNKPLNALKQLVSDCGSQKDAADKLGITPQYLCDLLKERRGFSETVAGSLGFKKQVTFVDMR